MDLGTILQKNKSFTKPQDLHPKYVKSFATPDIQFMIKYLNYYVPASEFC